MKLDHLQALLTKEMNFKFEDNKKIGHIRTQFNWEKLEAKQFIPVSDMEAKVKDHNIHLGHLNGVCIAIQEKWLKNYETIEELCNEEETNYFVQYENVNYWIRLNPFGVKEYNCYVHMYHA
jgi:hypothetical protein